MAKRDKASIYVDAQQLLHVLYDEQYEIVKVELRFAIDKRIVKSQGTINRYNMKLFKTITLYERK